MEGNYDVNVFRPKAMKLFGGTSAGNRTRLDLKGSDAQLERKPGVGLQPGNPGELADTVEPDSVSVLQGCWRHCSHKRYGLHHEPALHGRDDDAQCLCGSDRMDEPPFQGAGKSDPFPQVSAGKNAGGCGKRDRHQSGTGQPAGKECTEKSKTADQLSACERFVCLI